MVVFATPMYVGHEDEWADLDRARRLENISQCACPVRHNETGAKMSKTEEKTPNPKTQNRNPNPKTREKIILREENGKKREGKEKREGSRQNPLHLQIGIVV